MNKAIAFVLLLNVIKAYGSTSRPVVITPLGKVEGYNDKTFNGRPIYSFEGVPYAEPPTGENRFKEPQAKKPWASTWIARTIFKCMQYNQYTEPGYDYVIGDEDCLYLNVYTPSLDQNANFDVIVYIHGGAFMFSHGGFLGPQMLLNKNVVYVKLNYRLGPLGFLSTEDDNVPGNNGIKDQIMALRWIKENIKYFGGNPDSVTLVGMSAGGASVHLHYMNKKSRGLFHKGISQSGCALNPWILMENPLGKTEKIAILVGCPTSDNKQLVECLKTKPAKQIVNTVREFQPWLYNPISPFGVVIDTWSKDPLLVDHPYNLLRKKQVADLPWIASFTNSEGLYPAADFYPDEQYLNDIDIQWNNLMPHILEYNYTVHPELHDSISRSVRQFYLKDKRVSRSTYMDFVQIVSDRLFLVDIAKAVPLHASAVESPVLCYHFTYRGTHSQSEYRTKSSEDFGACHGDDTSYIFKSDLDMLTSQNDRDVSQLMINLVTSFAKTGSPEVPIQWPAVSKSVSDPLTYLEIASHKNITVQTDKNLGNSDFWYTLAIEENNRLVGIEKDEL